MSTPPDTEQPTTVEPASIDCSVGDLGRLTKRDGKWQFLPYYQHTTVNGASVSQGVWQPVGDRAKIACAGRAKKYQLALGELSADSVGEVSIRCTRLVVERAVSSEEKADRSAIAGRAYDGPPYKVVIDDLSFFARKGEFVALLGPSGAGKTTLLKALVGQEAIVSGAIVCPARASRQGDGMAYVPQDDVLNANLTVGEELEAARKLRRGPAGAVKEALSTVGFKLEDVWAKRIGDLDSKVLSGGERKRVSIAVELVGRPEILLLDEPTSGLGADLAADLIDKLVSLAKNTGITIIATIHQPSIEEFLKFDRVLILRRGKLEFEGDPGSALEALKGRLGGAQDVTFLRRPLHAPAVSADPRALFLAMCEGGDDPWLLDGQPKATDHVRWDPEHNPLPASRHGQGSVTLSPVRWLERLWLLSVRTLRTKWKDGAWWVGHAAVISIAIVMSFGFASATAATLGQSTFTWFDWEAGVVHQRLICGLEAGYPFALVIAAVFSGLSFTSLEIIGERAHYEREHVGFLGPFQFVLAKYLAFLPIAAAHSLVLTLLAWNHLRFDASLLWPCARYVFCGFYGGIAMGLFVSAALRKRDHLVVTVPVLLIVQIVFGGLLLKRNLAWWIQYFMDGFVITRWSFEGLLRVAWTGDLCTADSNSGGLQDFGFGAHRLTVTPFVWICLGLAATVFAHWLRTGGAKVSPLGALWRDHLMERYEATRGGRPTPRQP
jgi:ABC-type multidrug transport system ATPase subunit